MTQRLKAATGADFLAAVPAIAGYRARNSVVCVLFSGRFTRAAFRLDLPTRHRHSDYRALTDAVIALATSSPGIDGVAPVIYTELTFESQHGIPWVDFARHLNERIHRSGLHITGSFCVAADGWGDYFEVGGPRSLEEIDSSALALSAPELDSLARLPQPDPAVAEGIDAAFDELAAKPHPVDHVEACLESEPDFLALATLIALAQSPANRDVMMAQIAFGRIVGEAYARDNAALHAIQAETGLSMDEVVRRELAAGRRDPDDELVALLWGKGRMRPDTGRIERAIAWLGTSAANVDPGLRPPLLCMLAWLSWARGLGSVGGAHVDAALAIDPGYGMAQVLSQLFATAVVPEWALPG